MPTDAKGGRPTTRILEPASFFEGVNLSQWLGISVGLGLLSAVVLAASEINLFREQPLSLYDFLQNFSVYSACTLMALIFGEKSSLKVFLLARQKSWYQKLALISGYGGLTGLAMGFAYHRSFVAYRFSPRVPFRIRHMKTWYDNFILSLSAAITEELVFRLLLLSAFLYLFSWLFRSITTLNPRISQSIPFLFSIILSSLLFGAIHGVYGFLFAFVAGIVLCLVFLRAGLESAILAHFVTNVVFFDLTYLR
jgi:membrane protease YdiL (CAAX protease family)